MVSDWRTLPWAVVRTETARLRALDAIEAMREAPGRLSPWTLTSRSLEGAIEHTWRMDDVPNGHDGRMDVCVEESAGLTNLDVSIRIGEEAKDVTIRCSMDLLSRSIHDPQSLLEIAIDLLQRATSADVSDVRSVLMSGEQAVDAAVAAGVDWTRTFEAARWTRCPLTPATLSISCPDGVATLVDPDQQGPNVMILKALAFTKSIELHPMTTARECDGFDAMETLHILKRLRGRGHHV